MAELPLGLNDETTRHEKTRKVLFAYAKAKRTPTNLQFYLLFCTGVKLGLSSKNTD
jgi:hypothetical protein